MICEVCGGNQFRDSKIISGKLANEWMLTSDEVAYIDRQQGTYCIRCGANLRSIALALAIKRARPMVNAKVLEVNHAGALTGWIAASLPDHVLVEWPEVDIRKLPFPDAHFDLVVHSDTLEHVDGVAEALSECRRVLRPGGALAYTVPIIVDKLTLGRAGLPPSYHGHPDLEESEAERLGLRVYTEFGADAWRFPIKAGFAEVSMVAFEWPSALALICRK